MLICLGDSHSSVFSFEEKIVPQWPEKDYHLFSKFKPIRIGPATAFNLNNKVNLLNKILNRTLYFSKDYVMFCFGEVDIRAHILKQSKLQKKDTSLIVKECVDRYIAAVTKVKPIRKLNKAIFAPIASWNVDKPYDGPSFGTNLERNKVTKIFNDYLENKCFEYNLVFVSIFEEMLNIDGTTNSIYLDDFGTGIHLSQRSMPLILKKLAVKDLI